MSPGHAYALTRMQARLASRPGPDGLAHLASIGDFGHFLQAAGKAGYGDWLQHLGSESGAHPTELAVRLAFRDQLEQVADWLPRRWQKLLDWLSLAPDLPILADLLRAAPAKAWVARDPRLGRLLDTDGSLDKHRLQSEWPELARVSAEQLDVAWIEAALARLPGNDRDARAEARQLLAEQLAPRPERVHERLLVAFRRRPDVATRITSFAGLLRLDFEFLRGHLARRRLQSTARPAAETAAGG
ncbi:MAG: hypothetical protein RQ729_06315 [Wenzhouxiangellaceae bacterium]|nr:hypothetical protein [Wenzhouxiangellaceae bacterium]